MSELPHHPWEKIAIDFFGPLQSGHHLLVTVDENSCFPLVEDLSSTTHEKVIQKLDDIFATSGVPTILKSDNGPPFNSEELKDFLNHLNIKHQKHSSLTPGQWCGRTVHEYSKESCSACCTREAQPQRCFICYSSSLPFDPSLNGRGKPCNSYEWKSHNDQAAPMDQTLIQE